MGEEDVFLVLFHVCVCTILRDPAHIALSSASRFAKPESWIASLSIPLGSRNNSAVGSDIP